MPTNPQIPVTSKRGIKETLEVLDAIEQGYKTAKTDIIPKLKASKNLNTFALMMALMPLQGVLSKAFENIAEVGPELADLDEAEFKKIFGDRITHLAWLATQDLKK